MGYFATPSEPLPANPTFSTIDVIYGGPNGNYPLTIRSTTCNAKMALRGGGMHQQNGMLFEGVAGQGDWYLRNTPEDFGVEVNGGGSHLLIDNNGSLRLFSGKLSFTPDSAGNPQANLSAADGSGQASIVVLDSQQGSPADGLLVFSAANGVGIIPAGSRWFPMIQCWANDGTTKLMAVDITGGGAGFVPHFGAGSFCIDSNTGTPAFYDGASWHHLAFSD